MIAALLPPSVAVEEAYGDEGAAHLYPEERALVADAVDARRREFATARACARRAMARLGHAPLPVTSDAYGAPRWPEGLTGSLTHCTGYRAAAVARSGDFASLGIDAEPHTALAPDVLRAVRLPTEEQRLDHLTRRHPGIHWGQLLFSAKESVYKAWYPLTATRLGFADADLEFRTALGPEPHGTLSASLLVPGPVVAGRRLTRLEGRWAVRGGLVVTVVTVSG
ncbi:4'-phosphopantetheinyl transferase superfamily protein [Streptomyces sp. NPDC001941]|uniref:4'-phosphopantetheinyl transferase family protein n=1 Tax=Streptomyces sp. NPDC001941 TaxID=3154659 RepID=UPI00332F5F44